MLVLPDNKLLQRPRNRDVPRPDQGRTGELIRRRGETDADVRC